MTGDLNLDLYLNQLQGIIISIDEVIEGIKTNIEGLGQENIMADLQYVSNSYKNMKTNIINNYYNDINNK